MRFKDRKEAGQKLAESLQAYVSEPAVIYALPRGGVVLGAEIARILAMPLDLLIPRKVGHPSHPEFAICAVTEGGHKFCDDASIQGVDSAWLDTEIQAQQEEAKRRRETYLAGRSPVPVEGKTAIIVDDGIATGLTARAAIAEVKERKPAKIIIAIPVMPPETATMLESEVDKVLALWVPADYMGSVGAYYENFDQVKDEEVLDLLEKLS